MKKSFTILSAVLWTLSSYAQIPNGDLESWKTTTVFTSSFEEPTDWATSNIYIAAGAPATVTKVTDKVSGNFAMRLETKSYTNFITRQVDTVVGLAGPGGIDITNESVQGIPFTQRPTSLKGSIKGTIMPGDSAGILALFTRYNETTKETEPVGGGLYFIKGTIGQYQPFNTAIALDGNPDTLTLLIVSSDLTKPKVGSILFVDNLSFTLPLGVDKSLFELNGLVYPNPCKDLIVFDNLKPEFKNLDILDLNGKTALKAEANGNKIEVNTASLGDGIYIYKWSDEKGMPQRTGKFTVIK
ncbi:MAG TPA: T9SS type A sorting domain-containing protein [Cytophagaceae bacterium]|jgi:hypothetical protein